MRANLLKHRATFPITLVDADGAPLSATVLDVSVAAPDSEVPECRMTIRVSFEDYQRIDENSLFNLFPEVRGQVFGGKLDPNKEVELEMRLEPDLIDSLDEAGQFADRFAAALQAAPAKSKLLKADNWYGLYIKQVMDLPPEFQDMGEVKVGYRTTWAEEEEVNLEPAGGAGPASPAREASIGRISAAEPGEDLSGGELFSALRDYFLEKGWFFTRRGDSQTLKGMYNGRNGDWWCYAHAREEARQIQFYSVFPRPVAENRRSVVAELITRLNNGKPFGNFEMNLDSGDVRYKTALDLGGAPFHPELLEPLVEANVGLMDRYFVAIRAVAEQGLDPVIAAREADR